MQTITKLMKIRYSKARLRSNLRIGNFLLAIGIILVLLSFVTGEWKQISIQSIGVGHIGGGIFMLILYYSENRKQYLTLKNGELIKNTLFPKRVKLNEIKSIREFAGELNLMTDKNEFVIDTQIIEPNSLLELKNELKNHNLK